MLSGRGWSVQSDPRSEVKRESSGSVRNDGKKENVGDPNATFWTLCPYCWNLYEFYKIYEDCCLRCHNCQSPFHGVAVNAPHPEAIVEGKEEYYCCYGYFPIRYSESVGAPPEKQTKRSEDFVGFTEDSGNSCGTKEQERGFVAKESGDELKTNVEGLGEEHAGVIQGSGGTELRGNRKWPIRYKTVVRSVKKKWGNRMYRRNDTAGELDMDAGDDEGSGEDNDHAKCGGTETGNAKDCDQGDLKFVEGDGDILMGIRYS